MQAERVKGIEPSSSAWKAVALPLSYTRIFFGLSQAFAKYNNHAVTATAFLWLMTSWQKPNLIIQWEMEDSNLRSR